MAENLQGLLDRIHRDGIARAESERDDILEQAKKEAARIVSEAEAEAASIRSGAKTDADREIKRAESSIRQAARDVVLSLREELDGRISRLVRSAAGEALTPEVVAEVLRALAKSCSEDPAKAACEHSPTKEPHRPLREITPVDLDHLTFSFSRIIPNNASSVCQVGTTTPKGKDELSASRNDRRKNDIAAMETRYAADYRKAKPCAARFRRARRINAMKTLEDPFRVLGRYADAMVFYSDREAARSARNGNCDVRRT